MFEKWISPVGMISRVIVVGPYHIITTITTPEVASIVKHSVFWSAEWKSDAINTWVCFALQFMLVNIRLLSSICIPRHFALFHRYAYAGLSWTPSSFMEGFSSHHHVDLKWNQILVLSVPSLSQWRFRPSC